MSYQLTLFLYAFLLYDRMMVFPRVSTNQNLQFLVCSSCPAIYCQVLNQDGKYPLAVHYEGSLHRRKYPLLFCNGCTNQAQRIHLCMWTIINFWRSQIGLLFFLFTIKYTWKQSYQKDTCQGFHAANIRNRQLFPPLGLLFHSSNQLTVQYFGVGHS